MFVVFMNNLPQCVKCSSINMCADDTTLYTVAIALGQTIVHRCTVHTRVVLVVNLKNTHFMVLSRKHRKEICEANLVLDNAEIQPEETIPYLWTTS